MNLQARIADTEFVAFDLETTGLHPVAAQIVEIGAVRFRGDGTVLEEFQQLVHPGRHIPAEVSRIHGITDSMVQVAPAIIAQSSYEKRCCTRALSMLGNALSVGQSYYAIQFGPSLGALSVLLLS